MTDDLTHDLDLLGDWLDGRGYTEEAGLCTRVMDHMHKQDARIAELEFLLDVAVSGDDTGRKPLLETLNQTQSARIAALEAALSSETERCAKIAETLLVKLEGVDFGVPDAIRAAMEGRDD